MLREYPVLDMHGQFVALFDGLIVSGPELRPRHSSIAARSLAQLAFAVAILMSRTRLSTMACTCSLVSMSGYSGVPPGPISFGRGRRAVVYVRSISSCDVFVLHDPVDVHAHESAALPAQRADGPVVLVQPTGGDEPVLARVTVQAGRRSGWLALTALNVG